MLANPTNAPTDVHGVLNLCSVLTPSSPLGATEVDYAPMFIETTSVLRLTAHGGGGTLGGLVPPLQNQLILLVNVSTDGHDFIALLDEDAGSTAAYRFAIPKQLIYDANGDARSTVSFTLPAKGMAWIWYDQTSKRWRVKA